MKKTTSTDREIFNYQAFFDQNDSAQQLNTYQTATLQNNSAFEKAVFLNSFLTVIKWTFLYLPGAAAIHVIMLGFALMFFYQDWGAEVMFGTLGIFFVSTFMIMLGIGKLSDLKYLKVVGAICLTSLSMAIFYAVLASFIMGDFFGFFVKTTLPLTLLIGYLVKRNIAQQSE